MKLRVTTTAKNSDSKKTSFMKILFIYHHQFCANAELMRFLFVKMTLSELQRVVKFCLKNPNKSKSDTVEHFKLLGQGFHYLSFN
jgi:hypothetical protein